MVRSKYPSLVYFYDILYGNMWPAELHHGDTSMVDALTGHMGTSGIMSVGISVMVLNAQHGERITTLKVGRNQKCQ